MNALKKQLFKDLRFGMFIHWGLYSIPAWHEQIQWRKPMSKSDYIKLVNVFNPLKFDPDKWIDMAQAAGMKYICFTVKHHDGFCMWDTKYTEYNIMNTPYRKDILKMLSEACKRRNFGLCIYYSVPDWNHPNSINQGGDHQLLAQNFGDDPDEDKYVDYVKHQVQELCTNYGDILAFFWDIPPKRYEPSINEMIRRLQPGIMINDRGYDKGDYDTPERFVPAGKRFTRLTEACQSVGRQSWGYRDKEDYYSYKFLMRSIDKIMTMGGNYLLNIGPKADGTIPLEAYDTVNKVGEWYQKIKEALADEVEPASHLVETDAFMITRKKNNLYIHFHNDPECAGIHLNPFITKPKKAIVLNNNKPLDITIETVPTMCYPPHINGPFLHLRGIPVNEITTEVIIIKLEFDDLDEAIRLSQKVNSIQEYRY
jgi:alpha-L-fucosidase